MAAAKPPLEKMRIDEKGEGGAPAIFLDELIYGRSLTEVQKLRFGKVLMTDPTRELIPTNSYYTESAVATVPCKERFLYTCTMNPCRRIHIYFAKWFGVLSKVCEHFRKSPCSLNPH